MASLAGRYDFKTAEPQLQARWAALGIYQFDPTHAGQPYTVDTPPTTVSGQIHIGHVYSYTQADIMARYYRMLGEQVFYPFGFDDNGLPTERFTERLNGIRARDVGRQTFIEACLELSERVEAHFERFWRRLGLSVDWRLKYSTIDARSRRVSQAAFIDLYEKGQVYRREAPTLWCPECSTAVAQAEVDDRAGVSAAFTTLPFALDDGTELPIATTRPELLPACVAVIVHPADPRYHGLVGRTGRTPLFGVAVPILADQRVEREKGTGAVMCCTFGDAADVTWWREHRLPLRLAITPEGSMNERAGPYAGLRLEQARAKILEDLAAAGLVRQRRQIEHTVGVHERCGTEIEYRVAGQWFVRLLDQKGRLLEAGRRIRWYPEYMRARYESWIEGLSWDWNLSRQRTYGVPFPVWYCRACGRPVLARPDQLPVDPQETPAPTGQCLACGGTELVPDTDVMDTWATSSVTPQICGTLLEPFGVSPGEFDRRYRPMSLRPNAHDIIRTWDFYTIVRSLYLTGDIPWTDVLISGHALDPSGKKISKSKLEAAEDPTPTLEQFSADAVRYWAASGRAGGDTVLTEEAFQVGKRLVTKLWNAARLVLPHLEGYRPPAAPPDALLPTDRWLLARLYETTRRATAAIAAYEFATAKAEVERFFWTELCDNYLELVKSRLYGDASAEREAAQYTLSHALCSVLKLLAPVLPHITDAIYEAGFAAAEDVPSIHLARWPTADERWASSHALRDGETILALVETVRRWKSERQLGVGAPLAALQVRCTPRLARVLEDALIDIRSLTRAAHVEVAAGAQDTRLEVHVRQEASVDAGPE